MVSLTLPICDLPADAGPGIHHRENVGFIRWASGDGRYRFTANSTLTDRTGNMLDGNGDGRWDAYQVSLMWSASGGSLRTQQ